VVGDDVDDDLQPHLVRAGDEGVGVGQRAEPRIDVAVVLDVVPGVLLGAAVEGGEPDGVDAELGQVGQVRGDARQVADRRMRGGEGARVDLVDDGVGPPLTGEGGAVEFTGHG
jgi:hypothetical protein